MKEFIIKDNKTNRPATGGYVIQRITKRAAVTVVRRSPTGELGAESKLTTSAEIAALTSDKVKFMSQDYFEIFPIRPDGKSEDYDSFQNGPIVEYRRGRRGHKVFITPLTDDDFNTKNTLFSKGTITQIGASIYFPAADPHYSRIRALAGWTTDRNTPANGLLYLPYSDEANEAIFATAKSNVLEHTVSVLWDYPTPGGGESHRSTTHASVANISPPGPLARGA